MKGKNERLILLVPAENYFAELRKREGRHTRTNFRRHPKRGIQIEKSVSLDKETEVAMEQKQRDEKVHHVQKRFRQVGSGSKNGF